MKNPNTAVEKINSPKVELFIATGCAHCPHVMSDLSQLLKLGKLSQLNITNIAVDNTKALELNIRSVPWFSLSNENASMAFSGNYSEKEITQWVDATLTQKGMENYIEKLLAAGELMTVVQSIQLAPETFSYVINMLEDEETTMDTRIGLDALLENFSATKILQQQLPRLQKMANEDNVRLQIDALHYLALTADKDINDFIKEKTYDKNKQIQDAANEALETLEELLN